jgi:predicted adenine nucleotide alpha hydrolase (AANH) superfamily ATPase
MYVAWGWQQFRSCLLFSSKKNGKLIKELHISHTSILYNNCVEYMNKNVLKIQAVIVFNKNSLKYESTGNGT